jgi:hypothetical protein
MCIKTFTHAVRKILNITFIETIYIKKIEILCANNNNIGPSSENLGNL